MQNNLAFWTGVVEDRNDPQQLGRCRVRIFGYHTEDLNDLPIADLPWAIPLQSVTSAAISGVGSTPVGIVPGTWVMGFFLDGEDGQKPVILGTVAGTPKNSSYIEQSIQAAAQEKEEELNVLRDGSGNVVRDSSGQPIQTTPSTDPKDNFGNLPKSDVEKLLKGLGTKLSNNNYSKEENGKLGKYQFSYLQLVLMGYAYRPGSNARELGEELNPAYLEQDENWTGKSGVSSKKDFLTKYSVQENAMIELLTYNYKNLVRLGKIKKDSEPGIVAGLLSSAHYGGYGNADKLGRKSGDQVLREAFITGAESVLALDVDYSLTIEERGTYLPESAISEINEEFKTLRGFEDPNKQYPKYEYSGQSDINKLALGKRDHILFQKKENNRVTDIPKARSPDTWEEPEAVFGAAYPYNQVFETEAGHVVELDSTNGSERIHIFHKSGAYFEIDPNGTMVRKTMGDDYTIVGNNNYVFVKGAEVITIEGKTRILVKDQAFLEVEGGLSITSNKNIGIQTAGIMGLICDKFEVSATNGMDFASSGPINIQGTSVNLSASDGSIVEAASRGIFHTAGEDVNVSAGKATRLEAGSEFTTKSGTATRLQSGNALDIKSAQNINIDAGQQVNIRMGLSQNAPAATKQNRTNLSRRQPPEEKTPESEEPDPIDRNASGQDRYLGDDDPDSTDEWNKREEDAGRTISTAEIPPATDTTTYGRATAAPRFAGDCREFENLPKGAKELNALPLSPNFKLGDLIKGGWSLQSQSGLPPYKIVCNLRNLCRNVLDPIKAKYPDLKINSGLRNITDKFPNEKSDHLRGCAVDISFSSTNRNLSELRDRAAWIQANIPYKQLLLEYTKDSKGKINSGWIHISHEISETSGSLIPTGGTPVATLVNHRFEYPKKLVNLA